MGSRCNRSLFCGVLVLAAIWFLFLVLTHGYAFREVSSEIDDVRPERDRFDQIVVEEMDDSTLPTDRAIIHRLNSRVRVLGDKKNYSPRSGILDWARNVGAVFLPEGATVGEPSALAGRTDHWQLARWFADTYERQQKGFLPRVKAGTSFSIFSGLCDGAEGLWDNGGGSGGVRIISLHLRGNRLILKLDSWSGSGSTKSETWVPLVEIPVSRRLPVGRYLLDVDWGDEVDEGRVGDQLDNDLLTLQAALLKKRHHAVLFSITAE